MALRLCTEALNREVELSRDVLTEAAALLAKPGAYMCEDAALLKHAVLAARAVEPRLVRRLAIAVAKDAARRDAASGRVLEGLQALLRVKPCDLGELCAKWPIAVRFWDFARLAPPEWKPINWPVVRGWAYLDLESAARLGEAALVERIVRYAEELDDLAVAEARDVLKKLGLAEKLRRMAPQPVRVEPRGDLPPCIASLLEALRRGENLPHSARFALAAFMCSYLLAMGKPVEEAVAEIAELFKASPDYDERVTRYQVEHICGLRGGGKRYSPPSCRWMRANGLCVAECGVKNPIQLVVKKR